MTGTVSFVERKRLKFLGLPWTFTVYTVKEDVITINRGFFTKTEDDCYMYKVQDVKLEQGFVERMFGLGCVVCYTGDTTDKVLMISHIRNAKKIKDYILEVSEQARRKRRTLNTLNIGAGLEDEEVDPTDL